MTTYLRQTVLRYGIHTQNYLSRVGINISDKELNDIIASLSDPQVDRSLCARNRYWDPVDLNALNVQKNSFVLLTSPTERNISYGLRDVLIFLIERFPGYYNRYFGVENNPVRNILLQKCILAENWLKERTLAETLSGSYYDSSEKVEEAVSFLERKISYGLALLLKPLYDIKEPESMFPRFIEIGVYMPLTRRFIELNIPRETAIYLSNNFEFSNIGNKESLVSR